MLLIDGSYQEGGGQIIRTAMAFSVLTQKNLITVD
jgi:RNA 3'-terminal phosphate cyclase